MVLVLAVRCLLCAHVLVLALVRVLSMSEARQQACQPAGARALWAQKFNGLAQLVFTFWAQLRAASTEALETVASCWCTGTHFLWPFQLAAFGGRRLSAR